MSNRPDIGQVVLVDVRNIFGAGTEKNWKEATVQDTLAQMFTSIYVDEVYGPTHVFREYTDKGRAWKFNT